ncbi:MAG: hypothetical protein EHM61_18315 [Acidobacteria bacterium]|nr:MAG: hypothetical protein EHM61_18315 [Acidobacteriota bacterium]
MKIYDISHTIRPGMAVWPGDTPVSRAITLKMEEGDPADCSSMTLSLHTGTHLDAPAHYLKGACTVDRIDLSVLVGPAELVTVSSPGGAIQPGGLERLLKGQPRRLLIRANPPTDLGEFPQGYVPLSVEAAEAIVAAGVQLLGVDAPSVDRFDSESLPVHQVLGNRGVIIVENLRLNRVPDGRYTLVALPLKIEGGDGSPIRAVLIDDL